MKGLPPLKLFISRKDYIMGKQTHTQAERPAAALYSCAEEGLLHVPAAEFMQTWKMFAYQLTV